MIRLSNVRKQFGRRVAVDNLSLEVPKGEIFGLLGHNGAGKSTAIGMMLGQVWPDSGQVNIGGFDVLSERQFALQRVGAIFETPGFYDYRSGWNNLCIFTGYTAKLSDSERRAAESVTAAVLNKLLHLPTIRMKEAAAAADGVIYADAVRHLFGLEDER